MKNLIKYLSSAAIAALIYTGFCGVSAYAQESSEAADTTEEVTEAVTDVTTEPVQTTVTLATSETETTSVTFTDTTTTVSVTETTPEVTVPVEDGWNNIGGKWFYYTDGVAATGITDIDGESYLFATNGALKTGWQSIYTVRKYFDKETHSPVYGWISYLGNKYYSDSQNGKLVGMFDIEDNTYIFDKSGIMQTGFVMNDGYMYFCNDEGILIRGDYNKTPIEINGIKYIISPSGKVLRGWQTVGGLRVYFDYDTAQPVYGWVNYRGKYYYTDAQKGKYTGDAIIADRPYRFDKTGVIMTGLQSFEESGLTCYYYEDGSWAVGLKMSGKDTYYFDKNGYMATGWQTDSGNKYYFAADGKMQTGFITLDGKTYYLGTDGKMQTGLKAIGDTKYYFNSNGVMQTGWQTISDKKYYFADDGKMTVGWFKTSGGEYYFGTDGIMKTGFTLIGDNTYYFDANGKKCTGWQTISDKKYYFGTDGIMATYRHKIDNVDYLFYSNGVLAVDGNQIIVVKALSQLGNVGGQPYWTWYGLSYRIEWCACFVSWCAAQCGYTQNGNIPVFISCRVGINFFKEHGQWKGTSYTPKSGDFIFFDWEPDGVADHIGIVDYCEDGIVYTVEGNSSDMCRTRSYYTNDECIFGYASPNFKK